MITRRAFLAEASVIAMGATTPAAAAFDGRTVLIGSREYALTDIVLPSAPDAGAHVAHAALEAVMASGRHEPAGAPACDRWERAIGPIAWRTSAGVRTTLQGELIAAGAARVAPESADHALIDEYLSLEAAARVQMLGLWKLDAYAVRRAEAPGKAAGFEIFRGIIRTAEKRKSRLYFNFGDDYRTDLTASVRAAVARRWAYGAEPAVMAGASVELRGYVENFNGPLIELRHERQLRRL